MGSQIVTKNDVGPSHWSAAVMALLSVKIKLLLYLISVNDFSGLIILSTTLNSLVVSSLHYAFIHQLCSSNSALLFFLVNSFCMFYLCQCYLSIKLSSEFYFFVFRFDIDVILPDCGAKPCSALFFISSLVENN